MVSFIRIDQKKLDTLTIILVVNIVFWYQKLFFGTKNCFINVLARSKAYCYVEYRRTAEPSVINKKLRATPTMIKSVGVVVLM